jgi:arsenate reductase-like glutaredoxin family protein
LPEDEKTQDIIPLLVKYPALMKRPIINSNDKIELGWNKDVERRLLS